jgi:hypothetical protein
MSLVKKLSQLTPEQDVKTAAPEMCTVPYIRSYLLEKKIQLR